MNMNVWMKLGLTACFMAMGLAQMSCQKKEEVTIEVGSYQLSYQDQNISPNFLEKVMHALLPETQNSPFSLMLPDKKAQAVISSVQMCFKRLRFKKQHQSSSHFTLDDDDNSDDDDNEDNIDLEIGLVTLNPNGTELAEIKIEAGIYTRVEFDLENDCAGGNDHSLTVEDNGFFATDDRITIRFDGTFDAGGVDSVLSLSVQSIMNALSAATNDGNASADELSEAAESAGGTF